MKALGDLMIWTEPAGPPFIWEVSNTGPSRVQPETRSFWILGVVSSGWWSLQEAGPAEDHSSVNIYIYILSYYVILYYVTLCDYYEDMTWLIYTDLYWSMLYTYVLVFVWSIEGGSCVKSLLHSILDGKYPVMLIHWRAFLQSYGKKTGFWPILRNEFLWAKSLKMCLVSLTGGTIECPWLMFQTEHFQPEKLDIDSHYSISYQSLPIVS